MKTIGGVWRTHPDQPTEAEVYAAADAAIARFEGDLERAMAGAREAAFRFSHVRAIQRDAMAVRTQREIKEIARLRLEDTAHIRTAGEAASREGFTLSE